jgi:hypothetical protein
MLKAMKGRRIGKIVCFCEWSGCVGGGGEGIFSTDFALSSENKTINFKRLKLTFFNIYFPNEKRKVFPRDVRNECIKKQAQKIYKS